MSQNSVEQLIPLLTPGLKLSVNLEFGPNDTHSFTADYLGCKLDQYLIIDLPKKSHDVLVMRQINNVAVVIRAVTLSKLGHIVAFKSSVLSCITAPTGIILLRMPKHFASKPIRNHERYLIDMLITVSSNTVMYEATMIDFSVTGCAIFIAGENNLNKNSIINVDSEFSTVLPKNLIYSIVSIEKTKHGHKFGIRFDQLIALDSQFKHTLLEKAFLAAPV